MIRSQVQWPSKPVASFAFCFIIRKVKKKHELLQGDGDEGTGVRGRRGRTGHHMSLKLADYHKVQVHIYTSNLQYYSHFISFYSVLFSFILPYFITTASELHFLPALGHNCIRHKSRFTIKSNKFPVSIYFCAETRSSLTGRKRKTHKSMQLLFDHRSRISW